MPVTVGISGFGRIGRLVLRAALAKPEIKVLAINDLTDSKTNAHLFKYDSTHGRLNARVRAGNGTITVNDQEIRVLAERSPDNLPWHDLGVQVVVEATGLFTDAEKAAGHLSAGAKKVIITAPAKNEDFTVVMGVNEEGYDPVKHNVISNASCTTNCLAPIVKVLHRAFTINHGLMTTVHAQTNDQRILDMAHKDLRRARSANASIIPTTTGAARAVGLVLPELQGKLNGFAVRVPVTNVSMVDLVAQVEKSVSVEQVNGVLREAAAHQMQGIMDFMEEPLVSVDFNGDPHSGIVDGLSTMTIGYNLLKVVAWYDNEWGYSNRIVDLIAYIGAKGI